MSELASKKYRLSNELKQILDNEKGTILPNNGGVVFCVGAIDNALLPLPKVGAIFATNTSVWAKDKSRNFEHTVLGVVK